MLLLDTLRSTHAFLTRLRDVATSSKMQVSTTTTTATEVEDNASALPAKTGALAAPSPSPTESTPTESTPTESSPSTQNEPTPVTLSSHTKRKRRHRPRRVFQPEENSLYCLMYQHAGQSLFLRPTCWCDLHTKVLGARFIQLPPCDAPTPASSPERRPVEPSPTASRLSHNLTRVLSAYRMHSTRMNFLCPIIDTLFPDRELLSPWKTVNLHLYFDGLAYLNVCPVEVLWYTFDGPALAYISKDLLEHNRRARTFHILSGPGGSVNEPVQNLLRLRANKLLPANRDHDSYIVAVLLAMAQRRFYTGVQPARAARRNIPRTAAPPEFSDVKIRVLTCDDDKEFSVYTATVTAAFLMRFHEPTKLPTDEFFNGAPADLGMTIEYTKVPAWPILGLKERLGKALGKDLVGEFNECGMETWEESLSDEAGSSKRKRADESSCRRVLADISNESFEEDGNDDAPVDPKRRRVNGTQEHELGLEN